MKLLGTFCYNPQAVFPVYFVMRVSTPRGHRVLEETTPETGVEAEWDKDAGNYKLYTQYGKDIAGDDVACGSPTTCSRASRSRCAWAFRSCRPRTPA